MRATWVVSQQRAALTPPSSTTLSVHALMTAFHPDTLVTRQMPTNATTGVGEEEAPDLWRSAEAKYEQKRWAEQSEKALYQDVAFKRYQASVDKALAKFENVAEWADFISFLTRLLKALQTSSASYQVIPTKLVVAKRLSQCLNPALPSGVHTRALEVYMYIFTAIGVDGLRRDLQVWTPGLLPFFPHAATSVRPLVLDIYERFYLPLHTDLRPMTRALLLSLLPGVEEESSEFFDRVITLLDRLAASVQWPFFIRTMWKVMITSPTVRLSAFHYLARRMPKIEEPRELDVPLLGCAISHALRDQALLVRRQALDFLVTRVALDTPVFEQVPDKIRLLDAALDTVLRRDISLNRRLFSWLLGSDESDAAQQTYFETHARSHVAHMLLSAMQQKDQAQRAFKMYVSLMDKRAMAQPLLRTTVLDVFQTCQMHHDEELYPTAQTLFMAMDDYMLYQSLYRSIKDKKTVRLFQYILRQFRPHEPEALHVHLPVVALAIPQLVKDAPPELAGAFLELLQELMGVLDVHAFAQHTNTSAPLDEPAEQWFSDAPPEHVPTLQDTSMCTAWLEAILRVAMSQPPATVTCCAVLVIAMDKLVEAGCSVRMHVQNEALFAYIANTRTFEQLEAVLRMAVHVTKSSAVDASFLFRGAHLETVVQKLLEYLQPHAFQHHVAAVELFWSVCALAQGERGAAVLCAELSGTGRERAMHAVGTLWRCTTQQTATHIPACVLLILDRLHSHDMLEQHESRVWLQTYVRTYDVMLCMLTRLLRQVPMQRTHVGVAVAGRMIDAYTYHMPWDRAYTQYYLRMLAALLHIAGKECVHVAWDGTDEEQGGALIDVLKDDVMLLLRSGGPHDRDASTVSLGLEVLDAILSMEPGAAWCTDVEKSLVDVLLLSIDARDATRQIMVLGVFARVLRDVTLSDEECAVYADLVRRGMTHAPNDTALLAWTDFVHAVLPAMQDIQAFLLPVCHVLREMLVCAIRPFSAQHALEPDVSITLDRVPRTEAEVEALMRLLETALASAFSRAYHARPRQDDATPPSSILGNISSVFQAETASGPTTQETTVRRHAVLALQAVAYVWFVSRDCACLPQSMTGSAAVLERFWAMDTSMTLDAVIEHWWRCSTRDMHRSYVDGATLALLEHLTSSAQLIFSSVCDAISSKVPKNRSGRVSTSILCEPVLFRLLELYATKLDAGSIAQVWPIMSLLARTMAQTTSPYVVYHALRLTTLMGTKLTDSNLFNEQRTRRDVQDAFVRLCELTISLYGRSLDISSGRDSDAPSVASDRDETPSDMVSPTSVVQTLCSMVLPAFTTLRVDQDKIQSVSASLAYYILAPGFRARQGSWEPEPLLFEVLESLTQLPATSKTWRSYVLDTFFDVRFFAQSLDMGKQWAPMIAALFRSERDRLSDVIGRITTASSNLFTSRDSDLFARVGAIRRLSYVVYTSETNAFLAQLPLIQEKVVDILRSSPADLVHAEVYLCMRVFLCRFASQHLTGFWPIILTEMVRILAQAKVDLPADKSDRLQLVFSVVKLADFLITLQTDDFQIHQWLLITDTPDATNPASSYMADSLLDCLAKFVSECQRELVFDANDSLERAQQRRPLLQMSSVATISTLQPFFATASRAFYQCDFHATLDWDNINACLLHDLFEPIHTNA